MTSSLERLLVASRDTGEMGPELRGGAAYHLRDHDVPVAQERLAEMTHDDNYIVYLMAAESLLLRGAAGFNRVFTAAVEERPVGGMLWLEVALTEGLSHGVDVRALVEVERRSTDGGRASLAVELWDALWLDLDAADPGGPGRGVTPEAITADWTFVDWLRLSRVFLPVHAAEAVPGLARLDDERAHRRLVQMVHGTNVHTIEPACEALLASGTTGLDLVLRLCAECEDMDLLDGIALPLQWAVPGDLRAALTDRREHAPDPVVRASAAWALQHFAHAMPPLPGEPPREIDIVRLAGAPVPTAPEDIP